MNRLGTATRVRIVHALVEGNSVRATARLTGAAKGTVLKLLADLGRVCQSFHDRAVRGLRCDRVQCDEVWAFCRCKDKNVPESMRGHPGVGSVWTWTALCPDTKLMINWRVGDRDEANARAFMLDLAGRLLTRPQLTTDGNQAYPAAVAEAFGTEVDYAMLVKQYDGSGRYVGAERRPVIGRSWKVDISTSLVERQNLTMRMSMRRYTRKTNGFSKKLENHRHAVALHFVYYNFCRIHQTLRVTPAMEMGLTAHVWGLEELVGLLEAEESN